MAVLGNVLDDAGLADGGDCLLRRVISAGGRSRAFINGSPVTLSQLQALGTDVLTVRPGQGWHRGVRSSNARMYLTDAYAVQSGTEAITLAAPEMVSNAQVEFNRSNANMRVTGTTANFAEL